MENITVNLSKGQVLNFIAKGEMSNGKWFAVASPEVIKLTKSGGTISVGTAILLQYDKNPGDSDEVLKDTKLIGQIVEVTNKAGKLVKAFRVDKVEIAKKSAKAVVEEEDED